MVIVVVRIKMTITVPARIALAIFALLLALAVTAPIPVIPVAGAQGRTVVYVTNEISGDLTVIDHATRKVTATVPLGKRPRGLNPSPDGKFVYIALSGSPMGGPNVDESKLPPPEEKKPALPARFTRKPTGWK